MTEDWTNALDAIPADYTVRIQRIPLEDGRWEFAIEVDDQVVDEQHSERIANDLARAAGLMERTV